jgi:hypothetical protein
MSTFHIFVERWQPFTNFIIGCDQKMRIRHRPRELSHCDECLDRRQARNLEVQAYYDQIRVRCKNGKHPGWS